MKTVAVSIRLPIDSAAPASRVQMEAVSPKQLSLMRRMASSLSPTDMMPTTGPKLSSRMTHISCDTAVRT